MNKVFSFDSKRFLLQEKYVNLSPPLKQKFIEFIKEKNITESSNFRIMQHYWRIYKKEFIQNCVEF